MIISLVGDACHMLSYLYSALQSFIKSFHSFCTMVETGIPTVSQSPKVKVLYHPHIMHVHVLNTVCVTWYCMQHQYLVQDGEYVLQGIYNI